MTNIEGEVAIGIIRNQGKYLLLQRSEETSSSGKWNFPGGKIEQKESPQKAVLREIKEETSLEPEVIRSAEAFETEAELGVWKIYPFLLETVLRQVELNHEHSELKWIEIQELENLDNLGDMNAPKALGIN